LKALRAELAQTPDVADRLAEKVIEQLVGYLQTALPESTEPNPCKASVLAQQLDGWFQSLNYGRESYECFDADYCEWIITIPARRGYDRILVRCIAGEAGIVDAEGLQQSVAHHKTDEGWLVSKRRISAALKDQLQDSKTL
jgi:hypothetical protein